MTVSLSPERRRFGPTLAKLLGTGGCLKPEEAG
jgi:hypothetical protein